MLLVEVLPDAEFAGLADLPPFVESGPPVPGSCKVVVARRAGQTVAVWCLHATVHIEPLWVLEEERGNPGLIRRLWGTMRGLLSTINQPWAWARVTDSHVAGMAERIGFELVPGVLYRIEKEN